MRLGQQFSGVSLRQLAPAKNEPKFGKILAKSTVPQETALTPQHLELFLENSFARHSDDVFITKEMLRQLAYNEKMAELGKISAGVVHELNAPLSVIISASQMIMREEGVPEAVQEMIARIRSEAQRLSHLTKGLLNFSSHEETITKVDLNLTVDFILSFLNFEAARRAVTILKQLDYTLPMVWLDANILKQILLNIIMNALQAMEHSGGKLLIETTMSGDDSVCLVIADNGPGIQTDVIDRIFERYFTTKKPGEGTGLGLFVTKSLIEDMGGTIKVANRNGGGAAFTVTLPIRQ